MASANVKKMKEKRYRVRLLEDGDTHLKLQIPKEAIVRASSHKTTFYKYNIPNWTNKHFAVSQVVPHNR